MTTATATRSAHGFFRARVTSVTVLTPSFRRFTLSDPCLADYGDPGFDQRIKVVFPTPAAGLERIDAELQEVYAQAGVPEAWKLIHYKCGHLETAAMRAAALEWLQKWL